MKIEFFFKSEPENIIDDKWWFFVMDNKVYSDNGFTTEFSHFIKSFDDFIIERSDVGWRINSNS